jgi:hypothetical protein
MEESKLQKNIEKRIFPADALGIPLSIHIPAIYRNEDGTLKRSNNTVNKHHRWAPKKFLIHRQGEIGKVLRYSCYQHVPVELHEAFNCYFDKPELPKTRVAKFGALLLSIARYIPAETVDMSGGEVSIREMTDEERQLIWANNELRPEQGSAIQRNVLDYVARQDITGADESVVEEFLTTPSKEIRVVRGKQLLKIAAEVAVEPVEQVYIDAWEGKLLPRHDYRNDEAKLYDITQVRAVPKSPEKFIVRHVVKDQYAMARTINQLHDNLSFRYAA